MLMVTSCVKSKDSTPFSWSPPLSLLGSIPCLRPLSDDQGACAAQHSAALYSLPGCMCCCLCWLHHTCQMFKRDSIGLGLDLCTYLPGLLEKGALTAVALSFFPIYPSPPPCPCRIKPLSLTAPSGLLCAMLRSQKGPLACLKIWTQTSENFCCSAFNAM